MSHYIGARNRTSYGFVTGGYANLLRVNGAAEMIVTILLLICLTLPATLPILAAIAWPVRLKSHPEAPRAVVILLLASVAAVILGTLAPARPQSSDRRGRARVCSGQQPGLVRTVPKAAALGIAALFLIIAAADYFIAIERRLTEPTLETRAGKLRGPAGDLDTLQFVASNVRPEDRFFAFPYLPNFYLITGARNPTQFAYLQPGMFSADQERQALAELEASPPERILYIDVAPENYLRMWPGSDLVPSLAFPRARTVPGRALPYHRPA